MPPSTSNRAGRAKKCDLTLKQKTELLKELEFPSASQKAIARKYGVTDSAVSKIKKRKTEILAHALHRSTDPTAKHVKQEHFPTVSKAVYHFVTECQARNIPLSKSTLKLTAKSMAIALGVSGFGASNNWLSRFRTRYGINFSRGRKKLDSEEEVAEMTSIAVQNALNYASDAVESDSEEDFGGEDQIMEAVGLLPVARASSPPADQPLGMEHALQALDQLSKILTDSYAALAPAIPLIFQLQSLFKQQLEFQDTVKKMKQSVQKTSKLP